jgi:hypothetical protein
MVRRTFIFATTLILGTALFAAQVDNAFAEEEGDDTDIYVAPLDENASDEALREEAGSGFDTPGPFYIPEDAYDAGVQPDGTWSPDVPEVPEPEVVEYETMDETD